MGMQLKWQSARFACERHGVRSPASPSVCKLNKILCSFFRSISAHFQTSLFSASFSLFIFISLEEDVTKLKFFITLPPQTHQRMIQIFNLFEYNVNFQTPKLSASDTILFIFVVVSTFKQQHTQYMVLYQIYSSSAWFN